MAAMKDIIDRDDWLKLLCETYRQKIESKAGRRGGFRWESWYGEKRGVLLDLARDVRAVRTTIARLRREKIFPTWFPYAAEFPRFLDRALVALDADLRQRPPDQLAEFMVIRHLGGETAIPRLVADLRLYWRRNGYPGPYPDFAGIEDLKRRYRRTSEQGRKRSDPETREQGRKGPRREALEGTALEVGKTRRATAEKERRKKA